MFGIAFTFIGIIVLMYLGYRAWVFYQCINGCPSNALIGMPCSPQKCSFWTGKPIVAETSENVSIPGKVDLWCENGKYYKRTTTATYGTADMVEITRPEFDAFVAQGISYSGCNVGAGGIITP